MTFEQIGYFLALAEERSFVRAARRCGISQPSLSNAIRSLEAALGAPLFERKAAGSELTAFGKEMHRLLAKLHHDRLRALEFARAFDRFPHGKTVARSDLPHLHPRPEHGGRIARSSRAIAPLVLATVLACATIATTSPAWAGGNDAEVAIQDMLPTPFRCSRTDEPALHCREYRSQSPGTLVLGSEDL